MKEQVVKIREYVWQKYVDYVHPTNEIDEDEAVQILEHHSATTTTEEDPETYYLGVLLFEMAFTKPKVQNLYLAKAKLILQEYRQRTGETDWDVVEDRLEEIDDSLTDLGADERAELFGNAERELSEVTPENVVERAAPQIEGMVLVPPGAYLAGEENEERELESFYIDTFPVTNDDYRKFIEATGYRQPKFWGEGRLKEPRSPVVGVSWYDADKYATWAGKKLPSAEQWEKAARGLEGRVFPWGNDIDQTRANFGHHEEVDHVVPVDQFEENRSVFGACDLAGNVWEWTKDWDRIEIDMKVIQGGSWADPASFLRCDQHLYANPKDKYDNIGFRCVKEAD